MRKILDFYIDSHLHVALAVVSLMAISAMDFDLEISPKIYFFGFFSTISGYSFVKYLEIILKGKNAIRKRFLVESVFGIISGIVAFICLLETDWKSILVGIFAVIGTVFYAFPVFSRIGNFRNFPGLKGYVVALIWTIITVILPVVSAGEEFSTSIILYSVQRFLLVLILLIPFDIIDAKKDAKSLRTWPQQFGIKSVKKIGYILILLVLIMNFWLHTKFTSIGVSAIVLALLGFLIAKVTIESKRYFATFFVEAIPIIWWILYVIFSA